MRDRLELPLEFSPARNGYDYTQEVSAFPTLQITEGELFALLVAEKALQQYRGTTFERPLLSAFKKMAASLPDTISLNLADWEQTISFRTSAEPILNLENFDTLAKATGPAPPTATDLPQARPARDGVARGGPLPSGQHQRRMVSFRLVPFAPRHPHLCSRPHPGRQTHRQDLCPPAKVLPRRSGCATALACNPARGSFEVVIQFNEMVADYIREKKWHESQELRELPDGGVELRMTLSSLAEVERWILGWAGNARVLQPPELAESVKQSARNILRNFGE